ncbi:MAG: precorrin-6y C5,15-methyltransferase (decarboxylating) subunit CbiE [Nitrososphaeraceae archaeon]
MPKRLYTIGVGPGSIKYITDIAREAIYKSRYIIGYQYTISAVESLIDKNKQEIYVISLKNQEEQYQYIYDRMKDEEYCAVLFTGDVNFSESEVVDRLLEIFGEKNVEIIPGISSIQIAAAKSKVPLDKAHIVTFHVTTDIEQKKKELVRSIILRKDVILLPRPWPSDSEKNFMQSEIAIFLKENRIDTSNLNVWVFEHLTNDSKETVFRGKVSDLEGLKFSDLSVVVINHIR